TGQQAFGGETISDSLAAILKNEPDSNLLPAATPASLRRLLDRRLEKDPKRRLRDIGEARILLDADEATISASPRPGISASRLPSVAAAAAILALGALGGWVTSRLRQPPADDRVVRFQIAPPEGGGISGGGNLGGGFAISPDGQTVAFIGVVKGKTGL